MSGLDTSQALTVDASEHAEERHEHSRMSPVEAAEQAPDTGAEHAAETKD